MSNPAAGAGTISSVSPPPAAAGGGGSTRSGSTWIRLSGRNRSIGESELGKSGKHAEGKLKVLVVGDLDLGLHFFLVFAEFTLRFSLATVECGPN
jgi:hypothetical protein